MTRPGRASLMRTAVGLMGERGYEGTSTRDIAAAAGVSVAALYYHFPSKLDLLREFLHEAHDVVVARLARELEAAGDDPRKQLDVAVATLIAANIHDAWARRAAQVAWREIGRLAEPDQRAIAAKRDELAASIEGVVVAGVDAGHFTTNDPHGVARAVLTLCIAVVDPFATQRGRTSDVILQHQRLALALAEPYFPR